MMAAWPTTVTKSRWRFDQSPTDGLLWKWAGLTSFTSGTGYRAGLER